LLKVKGIDEIYVYCSSPEVIDYIPDGIRFLQRDEKLDGDLVKGFEIYSSFIKTVDADFYILAHTTSPFTKPETVESALRKVHSGDYDSAFSARRIQTFAWFDGEPINYDPTDVPRTQDIEPVFIETSAFFIFNKEVFTKYGRRIGFKPYIQEVSGLEATDIDEPEDFEYAKRFLDLLI
jgi:CMP-N-acetylneuraminic acid synthetase